jgi:hypothetical protein
MERDQIVEAGLAPRQLDPQANFSRRCLHGFFHLEIRCRGWVR